MRIILANVATQEEIERSWTLMDIAKWNEILDVKQEIEFLESEKLRDGN